MALHNNIRHQALTLELLPAFIKINSKRPYTITYVTRLFHLPYNVMKTRKSVALTQCEGVLFSERYFGKGFEEF